MENKYLVQAILVDNTGRNTIETVVDSIKTDDYQATLDFVMKRHKSSNHYLYCVMDIESRNILVKTNENKYYW